MDCEKLTPNAQKIFEQIKEHYTPDSWNIQQWTEDGHIYDNGWKDLKKQEVRYKLMNFYENVIGSSVITSAEAEQRRAGKYGKKVFNFKMSKRWIDIVILLRALDFQIETMDLVDQ